jgi:hypothetical protein
MIVFGVPVGYSGVNTLTDSSTMVKRGHKGDATVLRPTLIAAVPLVLERIYKVNTTFCIDLEALYCLSGDTKRFWLFS